MFGIEDYLSDSSFVSKSSVSKFSVVFASRCYRYKQCARSLCTMLCLSFVGAVLPRASREHTEIIPSELS